MTVDTFVDIFIQTNAKSTKLSTVAIWLLETLVGIRIKFLYIWTAFLSRCFCTNSIMATVRLLYKTEYFEKYHNPYEIRCM